MFWRWQNLTIKSRSKIHYAKSYQFTNTGYYKSRNEKKKNKSKLCIKSGFSPDVNAKIWSSKEAYLQAFVWKQNLVLRTNVYKKAVMERRTLRKFKLWKIYYAHSLRTHRHIFDTGLIEDFRSNLTSSDILTMPSPPTSCFKLSGDNERYVVQFCGQQCIESIQVSKLNLS